MEVEGGTALAFWGVGLEAIYVADPANPVTLGGWGAAPSVEVAGVGPDGPWLVASNEGGRFALPLPGSVLNGIVEGTIESLDAPSTYPRYLGLGRNTLSMGTTFSYAPGEVEAFGIDATATVDEVAVRALDADPTLLPPDNDPNEPDLAVLREWETGTACTTALVLYVDGEDAVVLSTSEDPDCADLERPLAVARVDGAAPRLLTFTADTLRAWYPTEDGLVSGVVGPVVNAELGLPPFYAQNVNEMYRRAALRVEDVDRDGVDDLVRAQSLRGLGPVVSFADASGGLREGLAAGHDFTPHRRWWRPRR